MLGGYKRLCTHGSLCFLPRERVGFVAGVRVSMHKAYRLVWLQQLAAHIHLMVIRCCKHTVDSQVNLGNKSPILSINNYSILAYYGPQMHF